MKRILVVIVLAVLTGAMTGYSQDNMIEIAKGAISEQAENLKLGRLIIGADGQESAIPVMDKVMIMNQRIGDYQTVIYTDTHWIYVKNCFARRYCNHLNVKVCYIGPRVSDRLPDSNRQRRPWSVAKALGITAKKKH